MWSRTFTVALFVLLASCAYAQKKDSLFVRFDDGNWVLPHQVAAGENIAGIARAYHVPPTILANMNGVTATGNSIDKATINIPVGEYNILKSKPAATVSGRPLYYRCKQGDNVFRVATNSGVPQATLKEWNTLEGNSLYKDKILLLGWILYDAPGKQTNTDVATGGAVISEAEHLYLSQTSNETNVKEEKGPAVFYDAVGKAGNVYYGFHNGTPHGTIIKVYNPGNGKTIFVKVMGPIPDGKQYYNAIIGISGTAKAALGVTESRAWCELKFTAN